MFFDEKGFGLMSNLQMDECVENQKGCIVTFIAKFLSIMLSGLTGSDERLWF